MRDVVDGNRGSGVACGRRAVPPHAPEWDRGEATGVWANSLTHHTRDLSYVAHKISQNVPRFVQKLLNGDGGVWLSWLTPTRVGVIFFKDFWD